MERLERSSWKQLLLGAALWMLTAPSVAFGLAFDLGWQATGKGGFSAPNAVCDAEGKTLSMVVCEKGTGVVCFDFSGNRKWTYAMTPPVTSPPAVADIDGDGVEEVVAADSVGRLAVLRSGDGSCLWTAQLASATAASSPSVVDLEGDGRPEVLVGDRSGTLTCLDTVGKNVWSFSCDAGPVGPVLVADVYDTPGKEVFVPSHDRCIYAVSAQGQWLWDLHFPDDLFPNSPPILADVDADKVPELYVGGGLNHFYRIDLANIRVAFEQNVYMHINGSIAATDFDGDGVDEVVFGTKAGAAYLYGRDGIRWTRAVAKNSFQSSPLVLPLGDSGVMAALFFSYEGSVFGYDAEGNTVAQGDGLGCKPEMSGPLAGDLDNDGQAEVVATSASMGEGNSGLFFFELGIPYRADARNRLLFGQDRAHTGTPPGFAPFPRLPVPPQVGQATAKAASVTPVGETLLLSGANTWRYDVDNPSQKRLALHLTLEAPGGAARHFTRHASDAKNRAILNFPVETPGEYRVTRQLIDADTREAVLRETETLSFAGIDSDTTFLERLFATVETACTNWRKTNSACADGLRQQLAGLQGTLLQLRAQESPDRPARLATLRGDALRLEAMAKAEPALAPTGSIAVWAFCPWAYFDPRATLPTPDNKLEALDLALGQEEYGTLALNVTNLSARSLEVRALYDGLEAKDAPGKTLPGAYVTLRRAVVVPTQNRELVADALPELDAAGALSVAALETQQLWITFDASGLAPGEYVANLRVKSIEPDPAERRIPIHVTIHDLAPPRPRPLNLCNWVSYGGDLSSKDDAVLKDLIAHGESVFLAPAPTAECDATGQLAGEPDFALHDEAVQRLTPHGFLLFLSPQGGLKGQPFLSEPWKKAFVLYLRAWASHLDAMGVARGRWALYPYDEPSAPYGETMHNLVEVAKLVREADPAIQIYTDPTSGFTMECAAALDGLIDIWQPSDELIERLGPEFLPVAKRTGKQVWFYEAAGNAKTLSCLGKYLWRFWYAWNQDFTGVGWWVYAQHGPDRWDGPNPLNDYWASIYDGPRGPVTSKRWEVTREGVQDYERLYALRGAVREAGQRGVPETELAAARRLLDELPKEMEAVLLRTGRRLPLTPDSVPLYEQTARFLDKARGRIAEARLKLKALAEPSVSDTKK